MTNNATFFADEDGQYPDYIEIHNRTNVPVNLEGWCLSDKSEKLMRWAFPDITLPADGYLAVHCSGEDRGADASHLHASFKLSKKGDDVFLTNPSGVTVSHVRAPLMEADQCYSLLETGWSKQFSPSPGYANTPAGADAAAEQIAINNTRGVRITEVLASSSKSDDWIELYNSTGAAVDLSGCGLSDNAGRPRKWQFPSGTVIQPGQYLGVFANGLDRTPVMEADESAPVKSVGNSTTTPRDIADEQDAHMVLMLLSESVAERLREQGLMGRVVSLGVRDCDLASFGVQRKLATATALASEICGCAMELFREHYRWGKPIRSLGVSVSDLEYADGDAQLTMFPDTGRERRYDLENAVGDIRRRFGHYAIQRACLIGCREFGAINPRDDHTIHPVGWKNG